MIKVKIKERYDSLDGLRAFACAGIVLMHVKANIAIKPTGSIVINNFIGATGDFVFLFMMVSAFALCCGYYEKFNNGNVKTIDFYKKRYTRILPFFALLTLIDVIKTIVEEHFHWTDVLQGELWEAFANVTLMFGLIPCNDITVVGVGWFLGVIFLFYLLFPFFTSIISTKKSAWIAWGISLGLYASLRCYFAPVKGSPIDHNAFMLCAPFFLVGGLIYRYRREIVKAIEKQMAKMSLILIALCYTIWFFLFPEYRFPLANLVMYALWLVYAISESSFVRKNTLLNNRLVAFLSDLSMEIYLCHMMMFRFVEKLHLEHYIKNNDVYYWITSLLVLAGAIIFSYIWKRRIEPKVINVIE